LGEKKNKGVREGKEREKENKEKREMQNKKEN
jgi:hypothetical protein